MNINHLIAFENRFALPSTLAQYAPDILLNPIHLELHFEPNISEHTASVKAIWTIMCKNAKCQELILDGIGLDIEEISDTEDRDIHWWQAKDKIHIRWAEGFEMSEIRAVSIQYTVNKPISGLYFSGPTELEPEAGLCVATDHETDRARYWLPCIDHSSVRTTLDIHLTHDKNYEALSSGRLISTTELDSGKAISNWRLESPCPSYLFCIVIGDLTRYEGGHHNNKPIAAFAPKPCTVETLKRCFEPTAQLIDMMTKKLGELPWPKYYQYATPDMGGAMENISLVSWGNFFLFDEIMHKSLGQRLDQINLHELAHTWFGDLVVCRDHAHVWLKESWATYMEIVWLEESLGTDEARYELINKRRSYFSEVKSKYSRPIMTRKYDSAWKMYDMHLYPGGAVRLHMLRQKLGDECFWQGVKNYIERYANQVVESDDFRHSMEDISGLSLAEFFESWFCRAGHPHLAVEYTYDVSKKAMLLEIRQTLIGAEEGDTLFTFPLDIVVQDSDGQWVEHQVDITGEYAQLRQDMDLEPKQIIIDPYSRAVTSLAFNPGEDILKSSLSSSDCPYLYGRIHAGEVIAKSGRRKNIELLENAFSTETFWGVRVLWAKALGAARVPSARKAILNLLPYENHDLVQAALAEALGHHRSHETAQHLHDFLQRVDIPYVARSAALISMGMQRMHINWDDLMEGLSDHGWWGFIRRSAVTALGKSQTPSAAAQLQDILGAIHELPQVRIAACMALAECSTNLTQAQRMSSVEALIDALQADNSRIRMAAVNALMKLPHPIAIAGLNSVKGMIELQNHPNIERSLIACRKYSPTQMDSGLNNRITKLEESIQKLHEKLDVYESEKE